jgi:hypothetical protein
MYTVAASYTVRPREIFFLRLFAILGKQAYGEFLILSFFTFLMQQYGKIYFIKFFMPNRILESNISEISTVWHMTGHDTSSLAREATSRESFC